MGGGEEGRGSVAMVGEFFYKESKSKKKILGGGGRMAWVSDFFLKNPNLKKRKYISFVFCVGEDGGGK